MTDALNLDGLEAIAEAATPGPWLIPNRSSYGHSVVSQHGRGNSPDETYLTEIVDCHQSGVFQDCDFIAQFDPPTVLRLITRLRAAEAVVYEADSYLHETDEDVAVDGSRSLQAALNRYYDEARQA